MAKLFVPSATTKHVPPALAPDERETNPLTKAGVPDAAQSAELPLPAAFGAVVKKTESQRTRERHPQVDWIKAVGILTVVFIHSLPTVFDGRISAVDEWTGRATRFAVPGFLACSGFLFASSKSSKNFASIRPRVERLFLPYFVFSVLAWCQGKLLDKFAGVPEDPTPFLQKLLFCSALGPFYYVFLILCLVLATPVVARIPRRVFPIAVVTALVLQLLFETWVIPPLPLFWQFRSPLRSLGPFLVGWQVYLSRAPLLAAARGARRPVWLALLAATAALGCYGLAALHPLSRFGLFLCAAETYVVLAMLLFATMGQAAAPEWVSWLSNASYTIYLSHLFFVMPVLMAWPYTQGSFDPLRVAAAWTAGVGNACAVVLLSRAVLGEERARKWIG